MIEYISSGFLEVSLTSATITSVSIPLFAQSNDASMQVSVVRLSLGFLKATIQCSTRHVSMSRGGVKVTHMHANGRSQGMQKEFNLPLE